jgi:hypothetical protein
MNTKQRLQKHNIPNQIVAELTPCDQSEVSRYLRGGNFTYIKGRQIEKTIDALVHVCESIESISEYGFPPNSLIPNFRDAKATKALIEFFHKLEHQSDSSKS